MAFATVVVDVTAPPVPFFTEPELSVPFTPASFASGQPSPSESKSNWFGIPSPSVSASQLLIAIEEKPISSTSPDDVDAINSKTNEAEAIEALGNLIIKFDLVEDVFAEVLGSEFKLVVAPFATVIVGCAV